MEGLIIESVEDDPLSIRMKPNHPDGLHSKILDTLQEMVRASRKHIEQREPEWDVVDEHMRLYVDLRRGARRGDGTYSTTKKEMPFDRSICVPLMYSTLMTRATHIYSILTPRDPFLHFVPRESNDFRGARLNEAMAAYDMECSNIDLQVWQMIMSEEKYGFGIWYDTWEQEYGNIPAYSSDYGIDAEMAEILGLPTDDRHGLLKEWNNVRCIDPRYFLPDPAFPITEVQNMGYVGHTDFTSWLYLDERRITRGRGPYFNVDRAKEIKKGSYEKRGFDARAVTGDYSSDMLAREYPVMPLTRIQWKLIPKDFGLSEVETPEKWWFECVGDERFGLDIIVRAHKSPFAHSDFTYSVGQGDLDMHAPFSPGIGQQIIGMADTQNWFVNSHVTNIRKTVNNQHIYNDDLISRVDVNSPNPAKHIRLTKKGKALHERGILPINAMFGQFALTDVTGGHMDMSAQLLSMTQRMAATPDTLQGMPLPTKRTLGEVESVSQQATMRLGVIAQMLDRQIIKPMAERLVSNRQQFTSIEQYVRVAGKLAHEFGMEAMLVRPEDLAGNYDYVVRTPTMPVDPARQQALYGSLLQIIAQAPQLMQPGQDGKVIDVQAIFKEFLKHSGLTHYDNFFVQAVPTGMLPGQSPKMMNEQGGGPSAGPSVIDDQELSRQVGMGNIVPMADVHGG